MPLSGQDTTAGLEWAVFRGRPSVRTVYGTLGRLSGADPVCCAAHTGQSHTTAFEGSTAFASILMRQPWSASVPAVRVFGASVSQRLQVSEDNVFASRRADDRSLPRHAACGPCKITGQPPTRGSRMSPGHMVTGLATRACQADALSGPGPVQSRSTFRPCAHAAAAGERSEANVRQQSYGPAICSLLCA
jgi:hypothetical protein